MMTSHTTMKIFRSMVAVCVLAAFAGTAVAQDLLELPVTFDDPDVEYLPLNDFGGTNTELTEDPEDPDNTVAITTRFDTAETWAGSALQLAEPIPFSEDETALTLRIYAPEAGVQVMLKVEQSDGDEDIEIYRDLDEADTWVTMEFDYGNALDGDFSTEYDVVAFFYNFGASGGDAGEQVYYWDELDIVASDDNGNGEPTEQPDLPLTFDDPDVAYLPMNDFGGVTTDIVEDPEDETNMVARSIREEGAQDWGGSAITLANPIPFASNARVMTIRVRGPETGIDFNLKIEQSDGGEEFETQAEITEANTWQTLEFDFTEQLGGDYSTEYDVVTVMPNFFPDDEPGEQVFYWDDVELQISTSGEQPVNEMPESLTLEQNYPNPFNPTTSIDFSLPEAAHATLEVYNVLGQRVAVLKNEQLSSGQHTVHFDATHLSSGTYIYRLQVGDRVMTRNLTLIK